MQTSSSSGSGLQNLLGSVINQFTSTSMQLVQPMMDTMMANLSVLSPQLKKNQHCCPPETTCPPQCIASIQRHAARGERIRIAMRVSNASAQSKTYQAGVREMKDQHGHDAPIQYGLNKHTLTLDPGRTELLLLELDLQKAENGATYSTEVVLREKEYNQNICISVKIDDEHLVTDVQPFEEQRYRQRWKPWQAHFYCEPSSSHNRKQ